jgi:iron complex transport system substrate-binding protein
VDKEKLLTWDPDIIYIDSGGNELVRQDYLKKFEFYNGLAAFKNRRVHILQSFNWYMTNLGTVVADAYTVGKILYPKQFSDVNPEDKADRIYDFLLGKPVYGQMAANFGRLGAIPDYLK